MRLLQAPLDICLDSPLLCQPRSSPFSFHGSRAFHFNSKAKRRTENSKSDPKDLQGLLSPVQFLKNSLAIFHSFASAISNQTAKSTHHLHKINDQHRGCKTGGGAYFVFFLGSNNSHTTTPQKYHLMRKVFCGDGAWLAVPYSNTTSKCFSTWKLFLPRRECAGMAT